MNNPTRTPHNTLFTANGCPNCQQAKRFLRQHRIPFVEMNVQRSGKAMKQLQRLGARGVPVLKTGQAVLFGFDAKKWQRQLLKTGPTR
jgi:glutaredoxin